MRAKKIVNRVYYKNYTSTFNASSSFQTFTVPAGVTKLTVDCVASKGGDSSNSSGGNGGRVEAVLPVTPNSTLYVYVGGIPSAFNSLEYNASDIRTDNTGVTDNTSLSSRLVVAGGGGYAGSLSYANGGLGGGLTGGDGSDGSYSSKGGTQTAGGSGGNGGNAGTFGLGGTAPSSYGGCGGAGWYGGGSGGNRSSAKLVSGAGGSSYTDSSCYNVVHTQGYNAGAGYITITYAQESSSSNYDFYIDFYTTKVFKETNNGVDTYKALKSWKKGQYYGN